MDAAAKLSMTLFPPQASSPVRVPGHGLASHADIGSVADAFTRAWPQKQTWPASTPASVMPMLSQCLPQASCESAQQKFVSKSPPFGHVHACGAQPSTSASGA
jgi:hypothetical protein